MDPTLCPHDYGEDNNSVCCNLCGTRNREYVSPET